MKTSIWFASALCAQLVGCAGWTVTATPVGAVTITSAPIADIELYPSTIYDGRTVYLYNDRWYYRQGDEWRYYPQEPRDLADQRERFRREPPPYVEVPGPPVPNIELYPSAIYAGRPAYLYGDRWYYRDGQRWRYYRREPPPLMQHRQQGHGPPAPPPPNDHHPRR